MNYQQQNISANNFEECIKCTICTAYCPVMAVNPDYPGPKMAGPDGERYRLKSPEFYDKALKYCLNCKRCEVSCPSNVKIGDIIQSARIKYDKASPKLRDMVLAETDLMGSVASVFAPIVNPVLKTGIAKTSLHAFGVDRHRSFPAYSSRKFSTTLHKIEEEQRAFPKHVAYYHGCYVNYNNPALGDALVKIMNAVGYGVLPLEKQKCCGVAKIANKMIGRAKHDAEINLKAIRKATDEKLPVLSTSSTCVFTIRDEYPHLLGLENEDVRDNIMLAVVFLARKINNGELKLVFRKDYKKRISYHTPCHMQKLGWSAYSIELLKMIPGVEFVPLPSQCCGIAGTYGFKKENYDYSQKIGESLFEAIKEANPEIVATDCETCKWQIEMSTGVTVENPISILADALDVEATMKANNVLTKTSVN